MSGAAYSQEPYGDPAWKKQGIMDGNLVRTIFLNHGEVALWPFQPSCEWPKGSGHSYIDGVAMWVAAEVVDIHGNTIHPLETNYREYVDIDPETGVVWGWQPLPGYVNLDQDSPAMSNDPSTWPWRWPDQPDWYDQETGDAFWNGYFGMGVKNADLETYFVMDDAVDKEFDFYPDATDSARGGLGLRVAVRGFQWSNVLAEDVIFWHYDIKNVGTTDYDKALFGMYIDFGIGGTGDSADDWGEFDPLLDIIFAWDGDGIGDTGWGPVGVAGYAFLESPGIGDVYIYDEFGALVEMQPGDGIDNDDDGLIDESRSNPQGEYIYGSVGIYNDGEPKWHWEGDEDGDWDSFSDINGNGIWDEGEPLNDDLGADGVGPTDEQYPGPDFGEGDGMPTDGEPDYNQTDKDESDQIGLTSVKIFNLHEFDLYMDETIWNIMAFGEFDPQEGQVNLGALCSSGPFLLKAGQTERFSTVLLFGEDKDDLLKNKIIVQRIYNGGYSFDTHDVSITSPIGGETLSGSVDINWSASGTGDPLEVGIYYSFDDGNTWTVLADNEPNDGTFSWDTTPLADGIFYRLMVAATNNEGVGMSISDTSFTINNPVAAAPQVILQSPLGGEELSGMHNITWRAGDADGDMVSVLVLSSTDGGETFNLFSGEDNDGQFEWDTNPLPNGNNYKIKLVVSDGTLMGEDQSDEVFQVNNQRFPLSDFYPDTLGVAHVAGPGTGSVQVNIVFPSALTYHIYEISFDDTSGDQTTYDVFDLTIGEFVILDAEELTSEVEGPLFDGIRLLIEDAPIELIEEETRWIAGSNSDYNHKVELGVNVDPYPADYDITFFDEVIGTDSSSTPNDVNFTVMNITENRPANFRFQDLNGDGFWSSNERMRIREKFEGEEKKTWRVTLTDTTGTGGQPPGGGDVFQIRTTKPFRSGDVFRFPEVITAIAFWPDETNSPYTYSLLQNYPNPFNPETTIQYSLAASGRVVIHIFNILGQKVSTLVDDVQEEGFHKIQWDGKDNFGRNIASGIYLYQIRSGDFVYTRKLLLLR